MKILKSAFGTTLFAIAGVLAQQEQGNAFFLSPETVAIYDFEVATKNVHYEHQFEDDYTVKITNKAYRINLFFQEDQIEVARKAVSRVLDGTDDASGFDVMIWKKTVKNGKQVYRVELKEDKLRIEINRKHSDTKVYETLNRLGQEFIKTINR